MALFIDKVEVVLLSMPRKRGMAPAENLLVRIHADGANGIGACQYESRYGETAAEAGLVVQKHYTPLLLKENPLSIETDHGQARLVHARASRIQGRHRHRAP